MFFYEIFNSKTINFPEGSENYRKFRVLTQSEQQLPEYNDFNEGIYFWRDELENETLMYIDGKPVGWTSGLVSGLDINNVIYKKGGSAGDTINITNCIDMEKYNNLMDKFIARDFNINTDFVPTFYIKGLYKSHRWYQDTQYVLTKEKAAEFLEPLQPVLFLTMDPEGSVKTVLETGYIYKAYVFHTAPHTDKQYFPTAVFTPTRTETENTLRTDALNLNYDSETLQVVGLMEGKTLRVVPWEGYLKSGNGVIVVDLTSHQYHAYVTYVDNHYPNPGSGRTSNIVWNHDADGTLRLSHDNGLGVVEPIYTTGREDTYIIPSGYSYEGQTVKRSEINIKYDTETLALTSDNKLTLKDEKLITLHDPIEWDSDYKFQFKYNEDKFKVTDDILDFKFLGLSYIEAPQAQNEICINHLAMKYWKDDNDDYRFFFGKNYKESYTHSSGFIQVCKNSSADNTNNIYLNGSEEKYNSQLYGKLNHLETKPLDMNDDLLLGECNHFESAKQFPVYKSSLSTSQITNSHIECDENDFITELYSSDYISEIHSENGNINTIRTGGASGVHIETNCIIQLHYQTKHLQGGSPNTQFFTYANTSIGYGEALKVGSSIPYWSFEVRDGFALDQEGNIHMKTGGQIIYDL